MSKEKKIKILLAVLAICYVISPFDLIPDFLALPGWLDDAFVAGVILYYLKRGALPAFLSWLNVFKTDGRRTPPNSGADSGGRSPEENPYEVLGLKPGASNEEIRAAYRRKAQAYHPDKVSHLGPELQALAKEKFVEIRQAYETLIRTEK